MRSIIKSAFVLAAMTSAATLMPGIASAGVSIGIGVPAVVVAPSPGYVAYDEQYYYDPIYISGAWYHGPYRWRMEGGERVFFVDGHWRRNEWREGRLPATIVFHNGGTFRDGRYDGFAGADRINARYRVNGNDMRQDHRDLQNDRNDMRQDRSDVRQDRSDMQQDRSDAHGDANHSNDNDGGH